MNSTYFARNVFPSLFTPSTLFAPNSRLVRQLERAVSESRRSGNTAPAINVWESDQCYFVEAELPGIKLEDLELSVLGNELSIRGERRPAELAEQSAFQRRERRTGSFARVVQLPTEVKAEAVEATLKNGVLTLRLPKVEAAKPKKIAIAKA